MRVCRPPVKPVCVLGLLAGLLLQVGPVRAVDAPAPAVTVDIRLRGQSGESWSFEQGYDVQMTSTLSADGKVPEEISQTMHQVRVGTITLVEARLGLPVVLRVTFSDACVSSISQTGQERQEVQFPLAGQTVTLRRGNDGSVENDYRSPLDDQTLNELRAMMEPDNRLYPTRPVAMGDQWKIGRDALVRNFQLKENDEGVGICRLDASKLVDGRPVADLAVGVSLIKYEHGFIKTEISLKGGARVDLSSGHTTAGILEGPLIMSGSQRVTQDGRKVMIKVAGEGKVSFRSASRWLNVSPVAGTEPPAVPPVARQSDTPVLIPRARVPDAIRTRPTDVLATGGAVAKLPRRRKVIPKAGGIDAEPEVANAKEPSPAVALQDPFTGDFRDDRLRIEMTHSNGTVDGTIRLGPLHFPFHAKLDSGTMTGTFNVNGSNFPLTAHYDGPLLIFTTDSAVYHLKKDVVNPLANVSVQP